MKRKIFLFVMMAAALMIAPTIIESTESNDWVSFDWDYYTYPYTWCFMDKVSDSQMNADPNVYDDLRDFFDGCDTPWAFYTRINDNIVDALEYLDYWPRPDTSSVELCDIVAEIADDGEATLHCQQQAILFVAGVKAVYSDKVGNNYVPTHDFYMHIFKSRDGNDLIAKHTQVVIEQWKGTWNYNLEVDPWDEDFKTFNMNDYPNGLFDSTLYTD